VSFFCLLNNNNNNLAPGSLQPRQFINAPEGLLAKAVVNVPEELLARTLPHMANYSEDHRDFAEAAKTAASWN
jgi:hypothetical protein